MDNPSLIDYLTIMECNFVDDETQELAAAALKLTLSRVPNLFDMLDKLQT